MKATTCSHWANALPVESARVIAVLPSGSRLLKRLQVRLRLREQFL
jgi:hypothetical protein